MSENKLVSADRMVELARHAYNEWNLAMAAAEGNRQINKCFKMQELCEAVESVVKAAPAADAVEVVRCKDCIKSWESCVGLRCSWFEGPDGDMIVADDDFCSYGERKVENERTEID